VGLWVVFESWHNTGSGLFLRLFSEPSDFGPLFALLNIRCVFRSGGKYRTKFLNVVMRASVDVLLGPILPMCFPLPEKDCKVGLLQCLLV